MWVGDSSRSFPRGPHGLSRGWLAPVRSPGSPRRDSALWFATGGGRGALPSRQSADASSPTSARAGQLTVERGAAALSWADERPPRQRRRRLRLPRPSDGPGGRHSPRHPTGVRPDCPSTPLPTGPSLPPLGPTPRRSPLSTLAAPRSPRPSLLPRRPARPRPGAPGSRVRPQEAPEERTTLRFPYPLPAALGCPPPRHACGHLLTLGPATDLLRGGWGPVYHRRPPKPYLDHRVRTPFFFGA